MPLCFPPVWHNDSFLIILPYVQEIFREPSPEIRFHYVEKFFISFLFALADLFTSLYSWFEAGICNPQSLIYASA